MPESRSNYPVGASFVTNNFCLETLLSVKLSEIVYEIVLGLLWLADGNIQLAETEHKLTCCFW